MMRVAARETDRVAGSGGFTIPELIVVMILTLLVIGGVYSVLIAQMRGQAVQQETMDVRETLRGAGAVLTAEFRHASVSRGDLTAIGAQSITLRSIRGGGVICDKVAGAARYAIWQPFGAFGATADDSALVYGQTTETWTSVRTTMPASPGTPCDWGSGFMPGTWIDLAVTAPSDTASVGIGSGIRSFQRAEYGMFQQDGRWWLGRKLGSAGSFELVTGPLRAPADSGLVFHYYDAANAETAVPAAVTRIEVVLRSESAGMARSSTGIATRRDSLRIAVFLRN